MNFLGQQPSLNRSTAPERQPYDPGGPVPVGWGWSRVAVKWIDHPWNPDLIPHARRPTVQIYSVVGVLCAGPVKYVGTTILVNGKRFNDFTAWSVPGMVDVSTGAIIRQAGHSVEIDTNWDSRKYRWRLYFGTVNQPADSWLASERQDGGNGLHPAYAGMCYIVFERLVYDIGNSAPVGNTSLPQMEFFVRRDSTLGGSWDDPGSAADDDMDLGNVPVGPVYDLMTNKVSGAGLPSEFIDQTVWQAKWSEMTSTGFHWHQGAAIAGINHSPTLAEHKPIENHLSDMLASFDGFLRLNDDGQVELGWRLNRDITPPANTPTLTRDDFVEEPQMKPGKADDLADKVTVTYRELASEKWSDDEGLMGDVSVSASNPHRRALTGGEPEGATIKDPRITRHDTALARAHRELAHRAEPTFRVSGTVFRDRAIKTDGALLRPGDLVWLDYDVHGTTTLFRVVERDDSQISTIGLLLEREPFFTGNTVEDPEDSRVLPELPAIAPLGDVEIVDVPAALYADGIRRIQPMVERGYLYTSGYEVYMSTTDFAVSGPEARLDDSSFMPIRVTCTPNGARIDIRTSDPRIASLLGVSFGDTARDSGEVLIYIEGEWIGLGALSSSVVSGSNYSYLYNVARGLFGSKQTHIWGLDPGWVFRKADMQPVADTRFTLGADTWWKFVPFGLFDVGPETPVINHEVGAVLQPPTYNSGEEPQLDGLNIVIKVNRPSVSEYLLVEWHINPTDGSGSPANNTGTIWHADGDEIIIPVRRGGWYYVSVFNFYQGLKSPPMDNNDGDPATEGWWIDATTPLPHANNVHVEWSWAGGQGRSHWAGSIYRAGQLWPGAAAVDWAVTGAPAITTLDQPGHPVVLSANDNRDSGDYTNNPHMVLRIFQHATLRPEFYYVGIWDAGSIATVSDDGEHYPYMIRNTYDDDVIRIKVPLPRADTYYYVVVLETANGIWTDVATAWQGWVYSHHGMDKIIDTQRVDIDDLGTRVTALESP